MFDDGSLLTSNFFEQLSPLSETVKKQRGAQTSQINKSGKVKVKKTYTAEIF
jgi:hypothetical protein